MSTGKTETLGKRTLAALVTFSLSVMMLPAAAFADDFDSIIESDTYYDTDTRGVDDETFAVSAVADNGQIQSKTADSINTEDAGALAQANHSGSATVTVNNSVETGGSGVIAYSRNAGNATVNAGNVNSASEGAVGAYATAWYENSQSSVFLGDVTAGAGVRAESNDRGSTDFIAGNVSATIGDASNFNANSFSSNRNSQTTASLGDVSSVTTGLVLTARNNGTTTVSAGNVTGKGTGMIVSNSGGTIETAVKSISSGTNAISLRDLGGQAKIVVNGNVVSSTQNGLVYVDMSNGTGKDTVLVTGTISGATNSVVADRKSQALDLTVWKIEAKNGQIIYNDDADGSFAKAVKYIVKMEQPSIGGSLNAIKSDGSEPEKSQGYDIAREGDKILLNVKLEDGYRIIGAYNGQDEQVELLQDENGNYYIVVPKGGGIYLSVVLEQDDAMSFVAPDEDTSPAITQVENTAVANTANDASVSPASNEKASTKTVSTSSPTPKTKDESPLLPAATIMMLALFACAAARTKRKMQ